MTEDSSIVEDAGSKGFGNLGIAKIVLTPTPPFWQVDRFDNNILG